MFTTKSKSVHIFILLFSIILVLVVGIYFLFPQSFSLYTKKVKEQSFATVSGDSFLLSSVLGSIEAPKKPVIVVFWTSWCQSCRASLLTTNELYRIYQKDIEIVGVNMQEAKSVARAYVDDAGILFPMMYDPHKILLKKFTVKNANTYVLIDQEGNVIDHITRDLQSADILRLLGE